MLDNCVLYGFAFEDSYDVLHGSDESVSNIINKEDIWIIFCNCSTGHGNAMYAYRLILADGMFSEMTFYNESPEESRKEITFATEFTSQNGTHYIILAGRANPRPYYRKLMQDPASLNFFNLESNILCVYCTLTISR